MAIELGHFALILAFAIATASAVSGLVAWNRSDRIGLVLGQAGNREDRDIRDLARVAAQARPDRTWLKDIGGEYLRGRAPGDIAAILSDALVAAGIAGDALPVCLDEALAAREALQWARGGDILVLPIHEPAARDKVVELLQALRATDWQAGQPLPEA